MSAARRRGCSDETCLETFKCACLNTCFQPKLPRRPPTLPREENWPRFHLHPSFASRHAHRAMLAAGRTALAAHCHVPRDRACHVCVHERSLECVRGPVGCAARRGDEAWATLDCSPHPHGSASSVGLSRLLPHESSLFGPPGERHGAAPSRLRRFSTAGHAAVSPPRQQGCFARGWTLRLSIRRIIDAGAVTLTMPRSAALARLAAV